jgi:hypothetical protein
MTRADETGCSVPYYGRPDLHSQSFRSTKLLRDGLEEMLAIKPLPPGYGTQFTHYDNIMIYGPTRCFFVTSKAIAEGIHKTDWVQALDGLIAEEAKAALAK